MDGAEVKLTFHTKEVVKAIEDAAVRRITEATDEVRNVTLETLSGNRTGRTYRIPGTKRTYTASSPGEPPAVATSRLRQDVKASVGAEGKKIVGKVGTTLKYGKVLEKGSYKMAPRPWLKPSFEKALDRVKRILSRRWIP